MQALMLSIVTYSSETLTIKARKRKRLDALEIRCWRRLLDIKWSDRRTNTSILQEMDSPAGSLVSSIEYAQLRCFGHIARRSGVGLKKIIVLGRIKGSVKRGWPRLCWTDKIKDLANRSVCGSVLLVETRNTWKDVVMSRQRLNIS